MLSFKIAFKNTRKTSNCLNLSAKYSGIFDKSLSSPLLFSRARKVYSKYFVSRADGIADEVRDPEKSLAIEGNRRSILCYRCAVQVHRYARGDEGSGKETVSWLPRSGRKHSYTSSNRIRNDTEVEEVETEMAPTFQAQTEHGRT